MSEVKYYNAAKYGGDCAFCGKKIEKNTPAWFCEGNIYCMDHTQQVVAEHAAEHPKAKNNASVDLTPLVKAVEANTLQLGKIEFQLQEMRLTQKSQGAK